MLQLLNGHDARIEQDRKARRWVVVSVALASIVIPFFVLPGLQAFLLYTPPFGRLANPNAPFNIYLNCLLNSVVMLWAMRLQGRLDRKISAVFSRVIIVHGAAAFIILILREYYSNQVMIVATGLSCILGLAVVVILDRSRPQRVAVIGGDERCALGLKIPCEVVTDPQTDLRGYDVILTDTLTELSSEWSAALSSALLTGKSVRHLAEYVEEDRGIVSLEHFDLEHIPHGGLTSYRTRKRILDIFLVVLSLPVTVPLVVLSMVIVRITMGGPALFVQQRIGLGGEEFTIYKLRTMARTASEAGRATSDGDLRVTPVGRFLRRYRIDELPQLWNVLKGDMSVIGPRPEWTVLSESYTKELPVYRYRSLVRPGITGWAQVCGGYASHIDEVKNKVGYDLYYIKNFSFALDVHIIIRTVWTLWTGFGAR